jgi:hypothetical protein
MFPSNFLTSFASKLPLLSLVGDQIQILEIFIPIVMVEQLFNRTSDGTWFGTLAFGPNVTTKLDKTYFVILMSLFFATINFLHNFPASQNPAC